MLDLICKISPESQNSSSKIGHVLAFSNKYLAFIIDFILIELVEYNKKGKKVNQKFKHFLLNISINGKLTPII